MKHFQSVRHQFFLKRFWQFFLIIFFPCFMLISLITIRNYVNVRITAQEASRHVLENASAHFDLSLKNLSYQNNQYINNPFTLLSLKRALNEGTQLTYADAVSVRNMSNALRSITYTYQYIEEVSIVFPIFNKFFSSQKGIILTNTLESKTASVIKDMLENKTLDTKILPLQTSSGAANRYFIVLRKMSYGNGVIIMKVDVSQFLQTLDDTVNGQGRILEYYVDNTLIFRWDSSQENAAQDHDSNHRVYNLHEKKGEVFYNKNYGLFIKAYTPDSLIYSQTIPLLTNLSALLLLVIALVAFLSFMITYRNFYYINKLNEQLNNAQNGIMPQLPAPSAGADEYDAIMDQILLLFLKNNRLAHDIETHEYQKQLFQFQALQSQINPHFIFNTLQLIQFENKKLGNAASKSIQMIQNLAEIMQYALQPPLKEVQIKEEIAFLKKYIAIQQLRFDTRLVVFYDIDPQLERQSIIRLILQPLVENSLVHGLRALNKTAYIKIRVSLKKQEIRFAIIDNGIGMNEEKIKEIQAHTQELQAGHIGLANVNQRLIIHYGEESRLKIRSKIGLGTALYFSIKINNNNF